MTPDERELLTQFLDDLRRVPNGPRDADAARMIEDALASRPDANYLLVQHALLADQALYEAQRRIAALEEQLNNTARQSQSFLRPSSPSPWGNDRGPAPAPARENPGFFGGGAPAQPGGFSSFLRNTAATAAGLAGGAFLFEGLSNLFGSHHTGAFLGGGTFPGVENASAHEQPLFTHTAEETHDVQDTNDTDYYSDDTDDLDNLRDVGDMGDDGDN
jgi:hypothetical protein